MGYFGINPAPLLFCSLSKSCPALCKNAQPFLQAFLLLFSPPQQSSLPATARSEQKHNLSPFQIEQSTEYSSLACYLALSRAEMEMLALETFSMGSSLALLLNYWC